MIHLTDDERAHVADYLEQESATQQGLANEARKLGPQMAMIYDKYQREAEAMALVAAWLRAWGRG